LGRVPFHAFFFAQVQRRFHKFRRWQGPVDAFGYLALADSIDGVNIVGWYNTGGHTSHGFLATIPEPAALPLLGLGMLLAWRRR